MSGEHMHHRITTLAVGLLALIAPAAWANSGGITGRSGKQSPTCTQCHGGGVAPDVAFIGPGEVLVGETAMFRFEVHSPVPNQRAAGFNVAASDGTLAVVDGEGERRARDGELTHTGPKTTDGAGITPWTFQWTAPDVPGTYTLFGAGNSVNLNGQSSGDRSAKTTFDVIVVEAFDTPTPTPTDTLLPSPTSTPTVAGTATATATITPTFAPGPCVGDCNASGDLTINEVITGVNILLGNTALAMCEAFDANGDARVSVNELIAAVAAVLGGCIPG